MASIVITGASTGIGEACALRLDRAGHTVFAGVRRADDGERLAARASSRLQPVLLDVCDPDQISAAAATVTEAVGSAGLSGLVNNAGIGIGGPVEFLPLADWRTQFEVNVIGQVATTAAFVDLIRTGGGRITFIGSISGRLSAPMMGPYSASKHAIEAVGATLREELRPWDIAVSVIEPGAVATPIWDKGRGRADDMDRSLPPEARERYADALSATRRLIERQARDGIDPDQVAAAVEHALFDARPKLRYLVGNDAKAGGFLGRVLPDKAVVAVLRRLAP